MSSNLKTIALVGVRDKKQPRTFVLKALTNSSDLDVTVISRKSSKSTFDPSIKVITVSDSYSENEMVDAFRGKDAVVLMTSHGIGWKEVAIIDAAIEAGVKRFIPCGYGSNSQNEGAREIFPMLAPKARLVEYLESTEDTGMTWTAIATGLFLDLGLSSGFMGYDIAGRKATIWDSGNVQFSTTTCATVATSVIKVLNHPNDTANKYLYISSFETSMNSILASLEKATGGRKWDVTYVQTDDQIKEGEEAVSDGDFMKAKNLVLAASFKGGLGADFATEKSLANDALGLPVEDFDTVIAEIVKSAEPS